MKVRHILLAAFSLLFSSIIVMADTFDLDPLTNGWSVDRYSPSTVESVMFDGDNRLHIGLDPSDGPGSRPGAYSSNFYNTQGIQKATVISGNWSVTGQTYISQQMLNSNTPWRTDLWARTGLLGDESTADYAILSLGRFDINQPLGGTNLSNVLQVWDSNVGWIALDSSIMTAGWNSLSIDGSVAGFSFGINGYANVFNDNVVQIPTELTATLINAYNYGFEQSHHWDNVNAGPSGSQNVPDTGSTLGLMVAGFAAFGAARSRIGKQLS